VSGQLQWQIITGQHLLWLRRHHRLGLSCESNTCKTLSNKNKTNIFKTTDSVTSFITYTPLRCKMSWRFRSSEMWCCVTGLHCDTLEIGQSPERFIESGFKCAHHHVSSWWCLHLITLKRSVYATDRKVCSTATHKASLAGQVKATVLDSEKYLAGLDAVRWQPHVYIYTAQCS